MTHSPESLHFPQPSAYPRPLVVGMRTEVPLFDGKRVRYVNLDSAASTPALVRVHQAVENFLPWYSSVHRGAGYESLVSRMNTARWWQPISRNSRLTELSRWAHSMIQSVSILWPFPVTNSTLPMAQVP